MIVLITLILQLRPQKTREVGSAPLPRLQSTPAGELETEGGSGACPRGAGFHAIKGRSHPSDFPYFLPSFITRIAPMWGQFRNLHQSPCLFSYPKTSVQIWIPPASSIMPLLLDHPHQHINTCCLVSDPSDTYTHAHTQICTYTRTERDPFSPYLTPTLPHLSIPLTQKKMDC